MEALIETLAAALAKAHGLEWAEPCGFEQGQNDCDSGTCIAAWYEDHDPDYARSQHRRDVRTILTALGHDFALNRLASDVHARNVAAGWWTDLATGAPLQRNVGEMLCLVHSEISEAMEGHRKSLMDDKLPDRAMIEVELADAVIRIADIAGGLGLDLGGAVVAKLAYNAQRADHKPENRKALGGKAY